jgi:hypothetical protein
MQNNETLGEMKKKRQSRKKVDLEVIPTSSPREGDEESDEELPPPPPPLVKEKKPRTPAQLAAFEKAKAIRFANADRRKKDRDERDNEHKLEIEEKVVRKAIAIKKKQIRQAMIIDSIHELEHLNADDEEVIKKVVLKEKVKNKVVFV